MLAWEFYITIILPQVINEFPFLCLLIYENFKFCEFKFIFTRQLIIFKSWWKILKFPSLFYLKAGAAPPSLPPPPAGMSLCGAQAGDPISFLCPINLMSLTNQWSVAPSLPRVGTLVDPSGEHCAFHKCFLLMKQSTLFYWIMFHYWGKLLSNLFVNEHH